ncbi:hypothetical protein C477_02164 [Haloterrigena salina JCM 13891]|uniref:Uncharacterized protein n=1 Tax=Haloterrigena salina JCM 13891 TaxID=1227488 RepID=M0CN61_9EURY|nr:hypothetical protein [Haloterrigena salina]ELZ23314.1 hypothetical protein C477_02164 [Haloterrigena salina JCM 13891]
MLESRDEDAFRPAPAEAEWEPESMSGVVGVRIATSEEDGPSSSEWLWSSQWLDLVAKR